MVNINLIKVRMNFYLKIAEISSFLFLTIGLLGFSYYQTTGIKELSSIATFLSP